MTTPKPATETISEQQEQLRLSLPFNEKTDFTNSRKGYIGTIQPNIIKNSDGRVVWDNTAYDCLKGDAPSSANPSLWQSQLVRQDGLFCVVEQIYQVRGFDISNVTFIEGSKGLIVIDPPTSAETASAALALYRQHRDPDAKRSIKGIIYTHSHVDHFGGVKGMIDESDVTSDGIQIIAPEGFLEHAVSENVYAETAMGRRSAYMYGVALNRGPQAQIGSGLGQTNSTGTVTLITPNVEIQKTGEEKLLDGVRMVFQMAPNSEAPAEMLIYFPRMKALCAAVDDTHTFHNILTLRGALVRDPDNWAIYLTETIGLWAGDAEVLIIGPPGTLRLLNKGYTGPEITERLKLSPTLEKTWSARGYYGSLSHNVKAVYQRYIGWFDGNPAHLWEHIPTERAKIYAELAGDLGSLICQGRKAFTALPLGGRDSQPRRLCSSR